MDNFKNGCNNYFNVPFCAYHPLKQWLAQILVCTAVPLVIRSPPFSPQPSFPFMVTSSPLYLSPSLLKYLRDNLKYHSIQCCKIETLVGVSKALLSALNNVR